VFSCLCVHFYHCICLVSFHICLRYRMPRNNFQMDQFFFICICRLITLTLLWHSFLEQYMHELHIAYEKSALNSLINLTQTLCAVMYLPELHVVWMRTKSCENFNFIKPLNFCSKRGILSTTNWKKANSPTFSAVKISRFTVGFHVVLVSPQNTTKMVQRVCIRSSKSGSVN
jgi:hypothetical protein